MTPSEKRCLGLPKKHLSLIILTFQNSALILIMHYSRIMPTVGEHRYFTSTAVFLNEVIKLAISLTVALYDISRTLPPSTPATVLFEQLYMSVFSGDGWKLAIPATLYTLQNSLQYIAVSNLDAVQFQILYQLKILTTALFSVTMLRRALSRRRWTALVLLTLGVIIVQIPVRDAGGTEDSLFDLDSRFYFPRSSHEMGQGAMEAAAELTKRFTTFVRRSATYEGIEEDLGLKKPAMNYSIGLAAVCVASMVSGLTGVYFEKVLKESTTHATVWTRNVQLSFYSLFPALIFGVIIKDGGDIAMNGFFEGYNAVVWTSIMFQALGGVMVSLVINYGDNIVKNFATGISIIISFLFSLWVFEFKITLSFLIGTAVVLFATYLYSGSDPTGRQVPNLTIATYEKTVIEDGSISASEEETGRTILSPLDGVKSIGLSTSRPSTPVRKKSSIRRGDQ